MDDIVSVKMEHSQTHLPGVGPDVLFCEVTTSLLLLKNHLNFINLDLSKYLVKITTISILHHDVQVPRGRLLRSLLVVRPSYAYLLRRDLNERVDKLNDVRMLQILHYLNLYFY